MGFDCSKRDFLKQLGLLGGLSVMPIMNWPVRSWAGSKDDPHFFIQVFFEGGWDASYLFDARPMKMTKDNLVQNYLKDEPFVWSARGGKKTLASSLVRPLKKYRHDLTIVKGVNTLPNFDGHPHNVRYFLSGDPFKTECFLGRMNEGKKVAPIDFVQVGSVGAIAAIGGKGLLVDPRDLGTLHGALGDFPAQFDGPNYRFLKNQYAANGGTDSDFQRGQKELIKALQGQLNLVSRLKKVKLDEGKGNLTELRMNMIKSYFQNGVCQAAIISYPRSEFDLDTHSNVLAKNQPQRYRDLVAQIDEIMGYLKRTPFDKKRSLLDVTTVCFSSEFGRSMRTKGSRVDDTGTNHNTFNNMAILAGRKIRSGRLVGETDFHTGDEKLSAAHLEKDADRLKVMGRAFDFRTQKVVEALPEVYKSGDYITMASVMNTIFHLFDIDESHYRYLPDDRRTVAPVLRSVVS